MRTIEYEDGKAKGIELGIELGIEFATIIFLGNVASFIKDPDLIPNTIYYLIKKYHEER